MKIMEIFFIDVYPVQSEDTKKEKNTLKNHSQRHACKKGKGIENTLKNFV